MNTLQEYDGIKVNSEEEYETLMAFYRAHGLDTDVLYSRDIFYYRVGKETLMICRENGRNFNSLKDFFENNPVPPPTPEVGSVWRRTNSFHLSDSVYVLYRLHNSYILLNPVTGERWDNPKKTIEECFEGGYSSAKWREIKGAKVTIDY